MHASQLTTPPSERRFWLMVALGGLMVVMALGAAHYMEVSGHIVTGMNNHVVWGLPHVFAIFLVVAASGVLNVASIGSVFGKADYKARAPLSGLLCVAMLAGGLAVLSLDLGRPERVIIAATSYNFTSVFAWNMFMYSGMFAIVALYLWTLMDRRMNPLSKKVGLAAFVWRLILTTCTGSIFAFLVAREGYGSALLAPMFIVMSFAWGLAVFHLVQSVIFAWNGMSLPDHVHRRMSRLLGVFVAAVLYLVAMHHLTNLYFARNVGFERFILLDGGVYPTLFWAGFVVAGSVIPLLLIYARGFGRQRDTVLASALVVAGAFCALYVLIVGGQAWPLNLLPGATVHSTFYDGQIAPYAPSLPELLLGIGGIAVAFLITTIGIQVFDFLPRDVSKPASAEGQAR